MTFLKKQKEEPIQDTPTPETASGTTEFDEELTMEEMEAKVQEVMEKYDRESNTRKWVGLPNAVIRYLMVAFAIYCVLINFLFNWETRIERASFVGCIVVFIFLLFPARKNAAKKQNYVPWYDVLLAIAGGVSYFYFVFNCTKIINQGIMIGTTEMIFGIIGIMVTLEACRRSVGFPIVIVASVFIIYAMTQRTLLLNVYNLFYTTEGVIGTPIRACSTFIVLFVMFGSFLGKTGITDFFIELANSIAGSSDGGPAKVAVISSALCGMVSGSSVGNTVTTGAITIPMMKRTGYKPEFAGAVEAAASTGGQIMPPIMGAAAFLMAEYASTPYSTIAVKAIIPAFLYFSGVFIAVHLEAKKTGLKGLSKEHLPKFFQTLFTKGYLLVPLIALVIFILKTTMALAAIIGTLLAIVVSLFRKETRITPSKFFDALQDTAKSTLTVGAACAVAGMIACVITTTGIGTKLISAIVGLAGGNLFIAMFLTMVTCIILGMGVPTTANYVIMATTCAPILMQMNMPVLCAHMFVFYFGIVADITPPVALAAYAGSAIAGSRPMKTALNATSLAIAAFIVPYCFGLNPALLLIDLTSPLQGVQVICTAFIGVFGVAAGLRGYAFDHMKLPLRIASIAGGLLLIDPGAVTDLVGIAIVLGICAFQEITKRRRHAAA